MHAHAAPPAAPAERLREKDRFGIDEATIRALSDRVELRYGEGFVGATFISGNAHFVVDAQQEPSFRNPRLAREMGLRGYACVPLTSGDQVLGVLSIMFG